MEFVTFHNNSIIWVESILGNSVFLRQQFLEIFSVVHDLRSVVDTKKEAPEWVLSHLFESSKRLLRVVILSSFAVAADAFVSLCVTRVADEDVVDSALSEFVFFVRNLRADHDIGSE